MDPSAATEEDYENKLDSMNFANFGFYVWSKERFNADLSDDELMAKFNKRFEKNLPIKYINLVFIEGGME